MSISYQSKDERVLSVALKVQELCVKLSDGIMTGSGTTAVIQVGESVAEVRAALFCDDSAGLSRIPQASITIGTPSGGVADSQVTLSLGVGVSLAADDSVILKYVVKE
jgi:hypothetical protein